MSSDRMQPTSLVTVHHDSSIEIQDITLLPRAVVRTCITVSKKNCISLFNNQAVRFVRHEPELSPRKNMHAMTERIIQPSVDLSVQSSSSDQTSESTLPDSLHNITNTSIRSPLRLRKGKHSTEHYETMEAIRKMFEFEPQEGDDLSRISKVPKMEGEFSGSNFSQAEGSMKRRRVD
ncbi:hypothetical protein BV25DRAFT_1922623 [Artomyces pyxidatus]|uniref:Uncharacterized protein n=1 Tax=Artomyces pyxidatus TaxID=48021 RepID=A0ACB8SF40_9AGAM|nr:hypothetical protein BV25DRAFT_1922623 [Artomyces pyxidatus]